MKKKIFLHKLFILNILFQNEFKKELESHKMEDLNKIGLPKEIKKEYSIVVSKDTNRISLYRFPNRDLDIKNVSLKETSKVAEVEVKLNSSTSALKEKNLNTKSLIYKATPTTLQSSYYTQIEGDKIILYKVHNNYLFQPTHSHHSFEYQASDIKKAENREEYEHRMKNINFKLKNIELEEVKRLEFVEEQSRPSSAPSPDFCFPNTETILDKKLDEEIEIKKVIKNFRICNLKDLQAIYTNIDLRPILEKTAEFISGRFILKNSFYEKNLHKNRSIVLEMFEKEEEIDKKEFLFLKDELWMVEELCDSIGSRFRLKGYKEELKWNGKKPSISTILDEIKQLFENKRVIGSEEILNADFIASLDHEAVMGLMMNNKDCFIHLSNGTFAINNPAYWLNELFLILENNKSFEISELEERLKGIEYKKEDLVSEIKKYCYCRGEKYYLKK